MHLIKEAAFHKLDRDHIPGYLTHRKHMMRPCVCDQHDRLKRRISLQQNLDAPDAVKQPGIILCVIHKQNKKPVETGKCQSLAECRHQNSRYKCIDRKYDPAQECQALVAKYDLCKLSSSFFRL